MALEYFSFEKVLKELQMDEDELKRLVSEGQIRAFRDEDRMKFRKDDIDGLKKGRQTEPTIILPPGGEDDQSSDDIMLVDDDTDDSSSSFEGCSGDDSDDHWEDDWYAQRLERNAESAPQLCESQIAPERLHLGGGDWLGVLLLCGLVLVIHRR